jgi:polysaccharide export outer membrane protein
MIQFAGWPTSREDRSRSAQGGTPGCVLAVVFGQTQMGGPLENRVSGAVRGVCLSPFDVARRHSVLAACGSARNFQTGDCGADNPVVSCQMDEEYAKLRPPPAGKRSANKVTRVLLCLCLTPVLMQAAFAQEKLPNDVLAEKLPSDILAGKRAGEARAGAVAGSVLLQADDEIAVHSFEAKEISDKTYRLDRNGEVNFPLAGVLELSGHSVREAEQILATALERYYFKPDVAINVTAFHVEAVSVLGAVGTPGVYQLKGPTTLLEALSAAGAVRGDAGPVVVLTRQKTRGPIPHPSAHQIASGDYVVEIDLKSLLDSRKPADNIVVKSHDVISVPLAELVYVVGDVKKAGGFSLGGKPTLSVLQALALAEGLDPRASPARARILRPGPATAEQIPVNLRKILQGKAEDVVLRPNDILFVPSNAMKIVSTRTIEAAIQIGTGLAIFRP